jgi:concentrative nucleoside transporter, CNT family
MASVQGELPLIRERSANSVKKTTSRSSSDSATKDKVANVTEVLQKNDDEDTAPGFFNKIRPYLLIGLALLILGWWISATVLQATRHRWYSYCIFNP